MVNARDERPEDVSPWEWKVPLGLLVVGLLTLLIHGLAGSGAEGGKGVLIGVGVLLVVYLPLTIAAMFIAAPLLDISFGELGPAVLKIAGLYVFTAALADVVGTVAHPVAGVLLALVVSLVLYSKAFGLTAVETVKAVFVVAVVRGLLGFAIGSLIPT
jgi:hypothetical protein